MCCILPRVRPAVLGFRSIAAIIGSFVAPALTVGLLALAAVAQNPQDAMPASKPLATAEDAKRFPAVKEDWTNPAVNKDALRPIPPLIAFTDEHPDYSVQLVQVQWRAADPIDLYVIRPKGLAKPPVILWLYGYPSETDMFKDEDFQKLSTKGGFAVVGFLSALTGHRFHDRPMSMWFVTELQESLATSAHDVQMVLDYLSSRDDLDTSRVGLFSQGSGASIGILAAAVDPRIKVLDALDPWGDWPEWMSKSTLIPEEERAFETKPEFLEKVATLDPLIWIPKLRGRTFRMQDSEFIKTTPQICREKLRTVLPQDATRLTYKTQDDFQAAADGGKVLEWIKGKLREAPKSASAANTN